MADVRVRMSGPAVAVAMASVVKAVDLWGRWSPSAGMLLLVVALVCVLVSERLGAMGIALVNLAAILGPLYSHNGTLLFWVASSIALFPETEQRQTVLRAQLSIMYAAAALGKLNTEWLSGEVLRDVGALVALPEVAAAVTIVVELALAVGIWVSGWRRLIRAIATVVHVAFATLLPGPLWWMLGLLTFNGLALALVWWTTQPHDVRCAA